MKGWRISAPTLTDEERRISVSELGGLSGQIVDTSPLLGKYTGERRMRVDPMFAALQGLNLYVRPEPEVVAVRRAKGRHARRSRAGNTAAIARQARLNRSHRGRFARGTELPVSAFLRGETS